MVMALPLRSEATSPPLPSLFPLSCFKTLEIARSYVKSEKTCGHFLSRFHVAARKISPICAIQLRLLLKTHQRAKHDLLAELDKSSKIRACAEKQSLAGRDKSHYRRPFGFIPITYRALLQPASSRIFGALLPRAIAWLVEGRLALFA